MDSHLNRRNMWRPLCVRNMLLALALLGEVLIGLGYMRTHFSNAVFIYLFGSAIFLYAIHKTFSLFFVDRMERQSVSAGMRKVITLFAASLLISFIFELGTLVGAHRASPFSISSWSLRRFATMFVVVYCALLFIVARHPNCLDSNSCLHLKLNNKLNKKAGRDSMLRFMFFCTALFVADLALAKVTSSFLSISYISVAFFVIGLSMTASGIVFLRMQDALLPERLFLLVALPVGMVFILAFPAGNVGSWDDETHYRHANSLSFIANVEETASDRALSTTFYGGDGFSGEASFNRFPIDASLTWSQADIDSTYDKLNASDTQASTKTELGFSDDVLSISSIGYIPSAVGLWLGRLLHVPFVVKYALGRVFNLLAYCLVSFFAIRIIPTKKVLISVLALIPTSIYMAANYSYDPWVISFALLAVALFVRGLLSEDDACASRSCSDSMLAFFIAFCPKAVYFPIMGIALIPLWNKSALSGRRRAQVVRFAVVLAIILVISFVLPLLFPTPGDVGDTRGTSEVNSGEQVRLILDSPMRYIAVVFNFIMTTYLPVSSVETGLTNYAYFGSINSVFPWATGLFSLFLCCIAVLDSDELSNRLISLKNAAWAMVDNGSALFLVCTSLYISFTAVGSDTIAGVQPRYLLPLLPTFFLFIFNFHVENRMKKSRFQIVVTLLVACVLYFSLWQFLVSRIVV